MTAIQAAFAAGLVVTLVAQAVWPRLRVLIVLAGAALSCGAAAVLHITPVAAVFAGVPWNVLLILVALGLFTQRLADTQLFGLASVRLVSLAKARPMALLLLSNVAMFLASSVVNNLTALLVLLPVLLTVLAMSGVTTRYAAWALGLLLVSCNLGGAATPIGDFPAVLLLGRGVIGFQDYLMQAFVPTVVALAFLLGGVALWVRPARDLPESQLGQRLTLVTLARLYRGVSLDRRLLWPCVGALLGMLAGWLLVPPSWDVGPELVAWLGAGVALAVRPFEGEKALKRSVDIESVLFLLALFLMVGVVRETGLFADMARWLMSVPLPPDAQLVVFLVVSAVVTGVFSAGPSMAALLEVADALAAHMPGDAVYVGLALSVCAGSSLLLTAATAGPLMQSLVERAGLRDVHGQPLVFGFKEFLPVGLLGFGVILAVGIVRTLWAVS